MVLIKDSKRCYSLVKRDLYNVLKCDKGWENAREKRNLSWENLPCWKEETGIQREYKGTFKYYTLIRFFVRIEMV